MASGKAIVSYWIAARRDIATSLIFSICWNVAPVYLLIINNILKRQDNSEFGIGLVAEPDPSAADKAEG
ncbi:hypothetical protein B6E78_03365 [Edwardsiella ictaluri]|nr:hypothetical protein B6E78_03365 [Edwardsiella ictaluri]